MPLATGACIATPAVVAKDESSSHAFLPYYS